MIKLWQMKFKNKINKNADSIEKLFFCSYFVILCVSDAINKLYMPKEETFERVEEERSIERSYKLELLPMLCE